MGLLESPQNPMDKQEFERKSRKRKAPGCTPRLRVGKFWEHHLFRWPGSSLFLVFCTLTIFAKLGAMCFTVT